MDTDVCQGAMTCAVAAFTMTRANALYEQQTARNACKAPLWLEQETSSGDGQVLHTHQMRGD